MLRQAQHDSKAVTLSLQKNSHPEPVEGLLTQTPHNRLLHLPTRHCNDFKNRLNAIAINTVELAVSFTKLF